MTSQTETPRNVATRSRVPFPALGEMDRFWDVLAAPWLPFRRSGRQLLPATDVFEKDGKLHIQAELPGLTADDIQIELTDDVLTISGERKDRRKIKEDDFYRAECSFGRFHRQFVLPAGADVDRVEARFKDGVLEVEVPVEPGESRKKIDVKYES